MSTIEQHFGTRPHMAAFCFADDEKMFTFAAFPQNELGVKTAIFRFVRFRKYE